MLAKSTVIRPVSSSARQIWPVSSTEVQSGIATAAPPSTGWNVW